MFGRLTYSARFTGSVHHEDTADGPQPQDSAGKLRERLAIAPENLAVETQALLSHPGIREGLILSTCNRVELLICHEGDDPGLPAYFNRHFSVDAQTLQPHLYEYRDAEAIRHLFRVASSLDSMVVGEPQILGQVKESYSAARSVGAVGPGSERRCKVPLPRRKKFAQRRTSARPRFRLRQLLST